MTRNVRYAIFLGTVTALFVGAAIPRASADPAAAATAVLPLDRDAGVPPPAAVPRLTPAAKIRLAGAAGLAIGERDLDAPMHLDARTPYLGKHAYLAFDGVMTWPEADPPNILFRPGTGAVLVNFTAEVSRSYLLDCAVSQGKFKLERRISRGTTLLSSSTSEVIATDQHVTAFVPKDTQAARKVEVRITQPTYIGQITRCEITPIR